MANTEEFPMTTEEKMDARLLTSGMTEEGEIPVTDRKNDGAGEEGCLMINVGNDGKKGSRFSGRPSMFNTQHVHDYSDTL
jgi:hypothetical protein